MVLHGHYLDHLAVIEPWTAELRARQTDGDPFVADPRAADHDGLREQDAEIGARFDAPHPVRAGRAPGRTASRRPAGRSATTSATSPTGPSRAPGPSTHYRRTASGCPTRTRAWTPGTSATSRIERGQAGTAWPATTRPGPTMLAAADTLSVDELRSPDGWSWVYDCLHGHVRKHLAMLGPWRAALDWPAG